MSTFSPWDEPLESLEVAIAEARRHSSILCLQLSIIQRQLHEIKKESDQQNEDLDRIYEVLHSIESRNYAKTESLSHADF